MLWDSHHDGSGESSSSTEFDCTNACCSTCQREMDKENEKRRFGSPMKHEPDLSLYGNISPERRVVGGCSATLCIHRRRPLRDHDMNSQDSGYGASYLSSNGNKFYELARSLGVTPCSSSSTRSFGSMDSMDAEFFEFSELEPKANENPDLPTDFDSLIDNTVTSTDDAENLSPEYRISYRPTLRRSMSLDVNYHTPNASRVRSCLFKTDENEPKSFKRPEPPAEDPVQNKRTKLEDIEMDEEEDEFQVGAVPQSASSKPPLRRSVSATEESIMHALQRSSTVPDLIGDFTTAFCLPLISGRHQDLKSITPATLAMLIKGNFNDEVAGYKVIDCRYPYEFDGGHIDGAVNVYTKDQILEQLLNIHASPPMNSDPRRRQVLIFHCEFSSERGPTLCRFLRNLDRIRNKDVYPALYYPEIYLLDGGYKNFYEQYAELCVPVAYMPMLHPEHQRDLRYFKAKSKTADRMRSNNSKLGLKRLGFM